MSAKREQGLLSRIERLRARLQQLVEEKGTLQDPEIQDVSRLLDAALNEHTIQAGKNGRPQVTRSVSLD